MQVVAYVRNLLGLANQGPVFKPNFKRRAEDEFSSDDEFPTLKRIRHLKKTSYPDTMASKDQDNEEHKVRYVPIQVETNYPSTSTPIDPLREFRMRNIPRYMNVNEKRSNTPPRPRMHTPVKPLVQTLVDDDDDDDEVTWVETKPESNTKLAAPKVFINLEEDEDEQQVIEDDDDVIMVKRVKSPCRQFKYFVSKNNRLKDDTQYFKLHRKLDNSNATISPKNVNKFKTPAGITKTYRPKSQIPVPRWIQSSQTNSSKPRVLNNSNTFHSVFNLDEKKSYQELIKRVINSSKSLVSKPVSIFNQAEESASFRNTQKEQKRSLNSIKTVELGMAKEKLSELNQEYDPITVASINSSDSEVEIIPSESSSRSTSSSIRINPVNSLRDSFKDKSVVSDKWLENLQSKYKQKNRDTQLKMLDARRESDIISKVNYEQKLALLEHKLKYELSIPESLIEEVPPAVELPELTAEQEKWINRALGPGPSSQLLIEKFGLRIHRRDMQTLAGLNWLNDEVINFYMNLLMQRATERSDLPTVYAANTFFYPKLMQSGQAGLRRWTRKVDIFSHSLMVVPVHLGVHWCLSIIDFRSKSISYLDSMGGPNRACLVALLEYLKDEHMDKKGAPFDDSGWKTECKKDIPQQMNGSDCGMFACTFAEFSCRDAPYTFTQTHMPYLRRKAALEILQGKLLL